MLIRMSRYPINKEFFPYPQEDCHEALKWTFEHADEIGIDRDRIGIGEVLNNLRQIQ